MNGHGSDRRRIKIYVADNTEFCEEVVNYFENNENVLKDLEDNKVTASNQTKTADVVQGAIDQALSHYDANLKGGK